MALETLIGFIKDNEGEEEKQDLSAFLKREMDKMTNNNGSAAITVPKLVTVPTYYTNSNTTSVTHTGNLRTFQTPKIVTQKVKELGHPPLITLK